MSSRPARRSSSSSSIVPWSIVSGVRSSWLAVETKARRAASWRRSSSCIRASARARSPTSSRRSSCGVCASGPSSVIRSAAARRRARRRSSVEESAMASSAATARPTTAATRKRLRTSATSDSTSESSRTATRTPTSRPARRAGDDHRVAVERRHRPRAGRDRLRASIACVKRGLKLAVVEEAGAACPSGRSGSSVVGAGRARGRRLVRERAHRLEERRVVVRQRASRLPRAGRSSRRSPDVVGHRVLDASRPSGRAGGPGAAAARRARRRRASRRSWRAGRAAAGSAGPPAAAPHLTAPGSGSPCRARSG